jgi:hypothetical protein
MKRIRQWLVKGIVTISLLLFIPTAVLFVRSLFVTNLVQIFRENAIDARTDYEDSFQFSMGLGGLSFERGRGERKFSNAYTASLERKQSGYSYDNLYHVNWTDTGRAYGGIINGPHSFRFLGFRWRRIAQPPNEPFSGGFDITIPLLIPLAIFGILPFIFLRNRFIRISRAEDNLCLACGYDLRATPDRCPECGTIPEKKEIISN